MPLDKLVTGLYIKTVHQCSRKCVLCALAIRYLRFGFIIVFLISACDLNKNQWPEDVLIPIRKYRLIYVRSIKMFIVMTFKVIIFVGKNSVQYSLVHLKSFQFQTHVFETVVLDKYTQYY